jgi:hypothetical protein
MPSYILTVIKNQALELHPGVSFQPVRLRSYPDVQFPRQTLAVQQPPEDQRLRETG